jgi:hypothetical protein
MSTTLPATPLPGAVPTLNGRGFMLEALDEYAEACAHAGCIARPVAHFIGE